MHNLGHIDNRVLDLHSGQQLVDHLTHGPTRIVGCRQPFRHPDVIPRARVGDTVGEPAADIHRNS